MLGEALAADLGLERVFYEEGALDEATLAILLDRGTRLHPSSRRVVERLSDLPSGRGCVALASLPPQGISLLERHLGPVFLLLDRVQDPVNVGAILRSAEAFGVSGALLTEGCASPFSARALRASAGSAFRVALATSIGAAEAVSWTKSRGFLLAGAVASSGADPTSLDGRRPLALAMGSEGTGLSPEVLSALDVLVTIRMAGAVESLNAAAAASVLLYALTREGPSSPKTSASNR